MKVKGCTSLQILFLIAVAGSSPAAAVPGHSNLERENLKP